MNMQMLAQQGVVSDMELGFGDSTRWLTRHEIPKRKYWLKILLDKIGEGFFCALMTKDIGFLLSPCLCCEGLRLSWLYAPPVEWADYLVVNNLIDQSHYIPGQYDKTHAH